MTALVADLPGAGLQDTNLVNPWGIAINPTGGPFWISDNGSDKATLYGGDVSGSALTVNPLVVSVPGGTPTGQVFNSTTSFVVTSGAQSAPALFIFSSEAGQITGWNPGVPTPAPSTSAQNGVTVPGAEFKGLAIGATGGNSFLYATDFAGGTVRAFNGTYVETALAGTFTDPGMPSNYAPFGIQNINGVLYVSYAQKEAGGGDDVAGAGHGYVDRFDLSGHFIDRFVTKGPLNSPWGIALAPATFGKFGGAILVGNFGDGKINAFDPVSGKLLGTLSSGGHPIVLPYLWGIAFGNGVSAGDSNALYFTAGTNGEANGTFGKVTSG